MARISLNELRARASTVDREKFDATTEADIAAQRVEEGAPGLEVPASARTVEPPRTLRVRLGLTQPEMAAAIGVPVGTWRNWEQGRTSLDPATLALLKLVSSNPEGAFAVLSPAKSDILPAKPVAAEGVVYSAGTGTTGCIVKQGSVPADPPTWKVGKVTFRRAAKSKERDPVAKIEALLGSNIPDAIKG